MKELSIEQKAKAYDEAIEKAKSLLSGNQLGNAWIYKLLPELKESEDEKIRKGILELVRQSTEILDKQNQNKMIAWLEEQGKKMSDPRYSILDKLIEADDIYQMSVNDEMIETAKNKAIDTLSKLEITKLLELEKQGERKTPQWMIDFLDNYRRNIGCSLDHDEAKDVDGKILCIKEWLENQGEQKHTDTCDSSMIDKKKSSYDEKRKFGYLQEKTSANNIGPVFHAGDWVVHDMSDGRKVIRQIVTVTNKSYILDGEEFNTFYFKDLENDYRLWTIQDANVNDVLVDKDCNISIYEEPSTDMFYHSYCYCNNEKFIEGKGSHLIEGTHLANKEERDFLFQKMHEAGYEWDAEKKELKKIGKKCVDNVEPKFKVGDWIVWKNKCYKVNCNGCGYELIDQNGFSTSLEYGIINENAHLWDITRDAKDGDILFQDLMDGMTFIYCGINPHMTILYSFIISNDGKDVLSYYIGKPNTGIGNIEENKNIIHPATKEQRDLLFAKMKEAGYEWDVNKKQLERIIDEKQIKKNLQDNSFRRMFEQNPAWSEEDEKRIENILRVLDVQVCWGSGGKVNPYQKEIDWLKYLKNRVEVKDVDLVAEISRYIKQHQSELKGYYDIRRIARHFFELGIKARKG